MLENQDMSAPIKLAEGYNPFGDENFVPQAQAPVEVTPTVQDEPNKQQQSAQVNQEGQPPVSEPSTFDPNQFVRDRFGYETVEEAENEFKRLKEKYDKELK